MDLLDLLNKTGGQQSLGNLASQLGLSTGKANDLVGALAPALMRGMQKQAESPDGLSNFKNAVQNGNHQRYLDQPELMGSAETRLDGNNILGHLFGSKDVSRNVAAKAAESTGIDTGLIKQALPMIAGLAMGALGKNSRGSDSGETSLTDLLGGAIKGGFDVDDVLGMAKKFF